MRETLYNFKVALQAFPCTYSDNKTKDLGEKKKRKTKLHEQHSPAYKLRH